MSCKSKIVPLPHYIHSPASAVEPPYDSCFIPRGFLFPESREDLAPYREFPLSEPFYSVGRARDVSHDDIFSDEPSENNDFDSTILQISELDELLLDIQAMGMQYTMHTQMCLRTDWAYEFPKTWDKTQSLLVNIPVFSEELCMWHYPISTMGYNIANTDPPVELDIAHNYPQLFGYLPNGDLALYWEIAEQLAEAFNIDLDPIHTSVEGTLVTMPNLSAPVKALAPVSSVVETGGVVAPGLPHDEAVAFAQQWLGRAPVVIRHAMYPFYRLILPVIHCELDFNRYAEATWGAFGYTSPRLTGFDFTIVNNPFTREVPIFSTERGNIIVSNAFFARLRELVLQFHGNFCSMCMPIQRVQ
ncbi:MAG: hypothetical protein ACI4VB_05730 [Bradymonadia bacterium]